MNGWVMAWVALSSVGLIVGIYLARESWLDLVAHRDERGGVALHARSRLVREIIRATVHFLYLLLGIPALGTETTGVSFALLVLMYGNLALMANSLIDAWTRILIVKETEGAG